MAATTPLPTARPAIAGGRSPGFLVVMLCVAVALTSIAGALFALWGLKDMLTLGLSALWPPLVASWLGAAVAIVVLARGMSTKPWFALGVPTRGGAVLRTTGVVLLVASVLGLVEFVLVLAARVPALVIMLGDVVQALNLGPLGLVAFEVGRTIERRTQGVVPSAAAPRPARSHVIWRVLYVLAAVVSIAPMAVMSMVAATGRAWMFVPVLAVLLFPAFVPTARLIAPGPVLKAMLVLVLLATMWKVLIPVATFLYRML